MWRPFVRFQLPDGRSVDLGPGDIIGRAGTAALRLDDPRISEAHAMVSLRGGELKLLALRGLLTSGRAGVSEAALCPGAEVGLAEGLALRVEVAEVPAEVPAIEGLATAPQRLTGSVHSVISSPRLLLVPRYLPQAEAHRWSADEGWRIQLAGGAPEPFTPGRRWQIAGREVRAVALSTADLGNPSTIDRRPLRIVARYETAHIEPLGRPVVSLSGIPAKLLSSLAAFGCPVPWEHPAREIWPDCEDREVLRVRWDRNLRKLRLKLAEGHIRSSLVRSSGSGSVELVLLTGDTVEDET